MIRDAHGNKLSPRQRAAEVMLDRLGSFSSIPDELVGEMTSREVALVNRQLEKLYLKAHKSLMKARGEAGEADEEDEA